MPSKIYAEITTLLFYFLPYEQVAVQEKRKSRSGAPPKKKRRTEDART